MPVLLYEIKNARVLNRMRSDRPTLTKQRGMKASRKIPLLGVEEEFQVFRVQSHSHSHESSILQTTKEAPACAGAPAGLNQDRTTSALSSLRRGGASQRTGGATHRNLLRLSGQFRHRPRGRSPYALTSLSNASPESRGTPRCEVFRDRQKFGQRHLPCDILRQARHPKHGAQLWKWTAKRSC